MTKTGWRLTEDDQGTARKLRALMAAKGITQQALADKAGVRSPIIYRAICGKQDIARIRTFIANELGFDSWDELLNCTVVIQ